MPDIGSDSDRVISILRAEALVVLICALVAYETTHASWLLFAILFFVPDLTMAGYGFGSRIGAMVYNAGHSYVTPAILALIGCFIGQSLLYPLALIWLGHVAFDRVLGYGLKLPSAFGRTHLSRPGQG